MPNFEVDLPGGLTIPVGDAANGPCGGMAYTVRDLFEAGLTPPATTRTPGDGPLFRYVADRLLDSLSLPFGPASYLKLMHRPCPTATWPWSAAGRGGCSGWSGRPSGATWTAAPSARSAWSRSSPATPATSAPTIRSWPGATTSQGTRLTLRLYDPNHPDDDEVTLSLDTAWPRRATPVTSSHGGTVWCFFRPPTTSRDPPAGPGRLRT